MPIKIDNGEKGSYLRGLALMSCNRVMEDIETKWEGKQRRCRGTQGTGWTRRLWQIGRGEERRRIWLSRRRGRLENRLLLDRVALFGRMVFGHKHISREFLRNMWDFKIEFAIDSVVFRWWFGGISGSELESVGLINGFQNLGRYVHGEPQILRRI